MTKVGDQSNAPSDAQPTASAGLWSRIGQIGQALRPRPRVADQNGAQSSLRPTSNMGRFLFGLVAYMVGSMALQYLLLVVDRALKLNLTTTRQVIFPANWAFVGSMRQFELVYLLLLVVYVYLLFRFNLIPRDLLGARAAADRRAAERVAAKTAITPGRSKSAQRANQRAAATTTHGTGTRRSGAAARAIRAEAKAPEPTTPHDSDDEYERVRALMRRQRKH
jgi:hypothetical protein